MKKTALIFAALAVAGVSYAADNVNVTTRPSYSVTSDFSYTSEYVFRGLKNSNAAFQGSVEVGQDDFRVGLWTNQPINSRAFTNEIDLYAGYKLKLARDLTADFVGTYYYYPESNSFTGETHDTFEIGVGGTYDLAGMSPGLKGVTTSLYGYYDFRLKSRTVQLSVGYSLALTDLGTSLDFSVYGGQVSARNTAPDDNILGEKSESYNYAGIGLNIPYKLAENAQVHIGASCATTDKYRTNWQPKQTIAVNAGITLGF